MSKMKHLNKLITEMEATAKYYIRLIDEFKNLLTTEDDKVSKIEEPKHEPQKVVQLEDVRVVLSGKAKDGYKNEIRALLNKYGAESLSALSTEHYAAVLEEAGGIGHD